MPFSESNAVELLIRDALAGLPPAGAPSREAGASYLGYAPALVAVAPGEAPAYVTIGRNPKGVGWHAFPAAELPRRTDEVIVEAWLREALVRLNPVIAAQPAHADEVLYKLRTIVLGVRSDGLIAANEEFTAWLRGERSMPFGPNHEHVSVRLVDFENLEANHYVVTTQYIYRAGPIEKRADLVLLVNGLPLVLIEAKTPVRAAVSWLDGALQVHDIYEKQVPELFVCNDFSVATEGKELRYGAIGAPVEQWGPWRPDDDPPQEGIAGVRQAVESLLRPEVVLDIRANYMLFATDKKKRRLKVVCRYQQYDAANKIVARVLAGQTRRGLIWHFQGSGKSLLMLFAAQKLRMAPALRNPTVIVVVDRIDLDAQISATFYASDIPNLVKAESREKLEELLRQDTRKIIITTIFKFGEADGVLNTRSNIVVMVDEAHRTQEGDLGRKMRSALPNAFLFGLTGTPINQRDHNTFRWFGAPEDSRGYLSRYGFEESIRDGATLPLHFEPRLVYLHINRAELDKAYEALTGGLSDLDREMLSKTAARTAVLLKTPDRIEAICKDVAQHFRDKVEPNGFKAMLVTYDQEACLLYKAALDQHMPPEASDVVISVAGKDLADTRYAPYRRDRDAEEKLLDRFRDDSDPLQILIVTAKLLTGFDAPILQAMYLDKPLRDHTLLQAIARTNRIYGERKDHGLIVDYLGVFDDVASALAFDEATIRDVISSVEALKAQLPEAVAACLVYFEGLDRSVAGYEGLLAAQERLPTNEVRDKFAADFSVLARLWEALSPDPILSEYESDYRWLTQVYMSVQPTSGAGALIWHAYGAKTIELIHQNVHIDAVRDDLEEIVLDEELVTALIDATTADQKAREIAFKVAQRLRKHMGNPRYRELSERLEALKQRHEAGQLHSVEFLKALLTIARDLLAVEKETPPEEDEDRGKAALTELFLEVRTPETPVVVERIVGDIDNIVRVVRFEGWQHTSAGERQVKQALRKTLLKYSLHRDQELFDKAFGYIRQYY